MDIELAVHAMELAGHIDQMVVCSENSSSSVVMVKSAKDSV
jgi:uncharacterized LabA/DUF88 family protein